MTQELSEHGLFTHFTPVQSVWGDMDALGHVNNVLYFRYAETARLDYMDRLLKMLPKVAGKMWQDEGMILAEIKCRFLQQLRAPADLKLGTRVARMGSKTLFFETAIYQGDSIEPCAFLDSVIIWFNYQAQKTMKVPDAVRSAIIELENVRPDRG